MLNHSADKYEYQVDYDGINCYTIRCQIYEKYIAKRVKLELENYTKRNKMNGFRQGSKTLVNILENTIGKEIRESVIESTISDAIKNICNEKNITAIHTEELKINEQNNDESEFSLSFSVNIFVAPNYISEKTDFHDIEVDDYEVEIDNQENIEKYYEEQKRLLKHHLKVEDNDYQIKIGDIVTVYIRSKIGNRSIKGGNSDSYQHTVTNDQNDNLSKNLIGMKLNDVKHFAFPPIINAKQEEEFSEDELVKMTAKVLEIKAQVPFENDEQFFRYLGHEDKDGAMDALKMKMQMEAKRYLYDLRRLKTIEALNEINKGNDNYIPDPVINKHLPKDFEQKNDEEKEKIKQQVVKDIIASLYILNYGKKHKIEVSNEEIDVFIKQQILMSGKDYALEIERYQNSPRMITQARDSLYESKLMWKIFSEFKKNTAIISFDKLYQMKQVN